jgi:hypothetical protein
VYHAVADPRDGTVYACVSHFVYGATVHRSADGGRTADAGATWELVSDELPEPAFVAVLL